MENNGIVPVRYEDNDTVQREYAKYAKFLSNKLLLIVAALLMLNFQVVLSSLTFKSNS